RLPVRCRIKWPTELLGSSGLRQSSRSLSDSATCRTSSRSFSSSSINAFFAKSAKSVAIVGAPSCTGSQIQPKSRLGSCPSPSESAFTDRRTKSRIPRGPGEKSRRRLLYHAERSVGDGRSHLRRFLGLGRGVGGEDVQGR